MPSSDHLNYHRVAEAIAFIRAHFKEQPRLEAIAEKVHLSPYHFQRLFTEWAGTSPKNFLQYISVNHARKMLKEGQATVGETAYETGFSGSSRLHDLFVKIEGMTPAEYKHGGKDLVIRYSFRESVFGEVIVAATDKGVCHLAFCEGQEEGVAGLRKRFPQAALSPGSDPVQDCAASFFSKDWRDLGQVKLHLKGTPFQHKVWEALLRIPMGRLVTYGEIADSIAVPGASRAVGTAIGSNPVAFLIPCHRVIQSTGHTGGYMWGTIRKTAMIGWEAAQQAPAGSEQLTGTDQPGG